MDFSTEYLGLKLRSPLVPSAAQPLSEKLDNLKRMEDAGAGAVVLHSIFEEQLRQESLELHKHLTSEIIENSYADIVRAVKKAVKIPVAVKISPFFTNMARMARTLDTAGADALVLLNRFYQPDIDLETLEVHPDVLLSTPQALRLPLRWIAILYGRVQA